MAHRIRSRRELLAFSGFLGLAVVMLWPLPARMRDHVFAAKYYWDAYTNAMALGARVQNVLGIGPGGHYDSYFFAPIPDSIVFNENLFGLSLLYAPFHLATGNPLLAYNCVLLLSLALSSYFTYRLVLRLTGSALAGMIAGVAFPYCPYAFFEMGRIQLVATQWIPLSFLFLHRAIEQRRLRDLAGLGAAYAMQVGTCLYYAMFMLPLLVVVATWLLLAQRPRGAAFLLRAGAVAAATAAVILAMIFPYFASRKNFALTRSEDFADDFDGALSFFLNVAPGNRALRFLHHEPKIVAGAHEEIAFPGFVVGLLACAAIGVPLVRSLVAQGARAGARAALTLLATLAATCGLAFAATIATRSMLWGTLVLSAGVALWWLRLRRHELVPTAAAVYLYVLVLAVLLFLGLSPFEHGGQEVRGLYYYLYTYVPGWNGIRKVSRQAIMTSFAFIVLAGYGAALLLRMIPKPRLRGAAAASLAALVAFEFHEAPLPLKIVPAEDTVPGAYRFIAAQPGRAPIALVPTNDGVQVFRGHPGMALHNYLALYHRRRTLNGKSSFIPPVTHIFNNAMTRLPADLATRVLRQLGAQYLVVHPWDMHETRAARVLIGLREDTRNYRQVYGDGVDYVFEVLPARGQDDQLADLPPLPGAGIERIPRGQLEPYSTLDAAHLRATQDGDPATRWSTRRSQRTGDWFEWRTRDPVDFAALELSDFAVVDDAPMSYRVEVGSGDSAYRTVALRPRLRVFREQVFAPVGFRFRVVLPEGSVGTRLRITILESTPSRFFSIHEAALWKRRRVP